MGTAPYCRTRAGPAQRELTGRAGPSQHGPTPNAQFACALGEYPGRKEPRLGSLLLTPKGARPNPREIGLAHLPREPTLGAEPIFSLRFF